MGSSPRAFLRHAGLPGAERQPAPRLRNFPAGMSKSFVRKSLGDYQPYVPGQQPPDGEDWVKLNTNESPLPPSPKVIEAIKAVTDESLRLYPSPTAAPARNAIGEHFGLDAGQVALGNGAGQPIERGY